MRYAEAVDGETRTSGRFGEFGRSGRFRAMTDVVGDLLQRVRSGEPSAWNLLVERYSPLIWRILGQFSTLTRSERDDLFQDVFVVLLDRGIDHFRGSTEHEFRAYLKIIAANTTRGHLRRHSRRFEISDPFLSRRDEDEATFLDEAVLTDPAPRTEDLLSDAEELEGVRRCLQTLAALEQEIFWSREREHPYKEIAKNLGLPLGTVATKYNRAKKKIEDCLRAAGFL